MRSVHKTAPVLHAKALEGAADAPGTFEAVWAVFGNEDSDGDVVEPGAFLKSWERKLPKVVWSHSWLEVPIGVTLEVDELSGEQLKRLVPKLPANVTGGAWAKARLAVDVEAGEHNPRAQEVYTALKMVGGDGRPALDEFSWGGRVTEETVEKREGAFPLWHLEAINQTEWGPCVKGANPETALIAAKADFNLERAVRLANGELVEGSTDGDDLAARKLRSYRTFSFSAAREIFGLKDEVADPPDPKPAPETEPAPEPDADPAPEPEQVPASTPEVEDPEERARVAELLFPAA
jgi:hypothetical protein